MDRVRKELTEKAKHWRTSGSKYTPRVAQAGRTAGTCTMMFGHVETDAERIEHLTRLRDLQDSTGGFTAFICWTMQHRPQDGRQ